mgnify:CR=1 FL=1
MKIKNKYLNHKKIVNYIRIKYKIRNMETEFIVVFSTVENFFNAHQISKILVAEKLAACCSIIQNITSVFEWEGKVEERKENLLIIKTTREKFESLKTRVKELHTDEVPEIIALNIQDGLPEYLDWIAEVTKPNLLNKGL